MRADTGWVLLGQSSCSMKSLWVDGRIIISLLGSGVGCLIPATPCANQDAGLPWEQPREKSSVCTVTSLNLLGKQEVRQPETRTRRGDCLWAYGEEAPA